MYIQCSCVHITKKILCNSTTVSQFNSVNFRTSAIVEPLITGYFDTTKILMESKSQLKQYIIVNYMVLYIVQLCFM